MKSLGFRARPPLAPPALRNAPSEASLPSWAPPGPPSPPASHPAPSQGASRKGLRHWPAPKCHHIAPRSTKNHSLGANIPRNSSQDAPATPPKHPKNAENLQNPYVFPWFLLSRPYAKLTPKSCKKPPKVAQVGHPRVKCDPC